MSFVRVFGVLRVKHGESNIEEEEGLWNVYVIVLLKLFGLLL
jgi:hypothetical protein